MGVSFLQPMQLNTILHLWAGL